MNMPPTQGSGPSRHRRNRGNREIDPVNTDLISWFDPATALPVLPTEPRPTGLALFANGTDADTGNTGHPTQDRGVMGHAPQKETPVFQAARSATPPSQTPRLPDGLPQQSRQPIARKKDRVTTQPDPSSHAHPNSEPSSPRDGVQPLHGRRFPLSNSDRRFATPSTVQTPTTSPIPNPALPSQTQTAGRDNTAKDAAGHVLHSERSLVPASRIAAPPKDNSRWHGAPTQNDNRPSPQHEDLVATRPEPSSRTNPPVEPPVPPEEVVTPQWSGPPSPPSDDAPTTALAVQAATTPPSPVVQGRPGTPIQTAPRPQSGDVDNAVKGVAGHPRQAETAAFPPVKMPVPPNRTTRTRGKRPDNSSRPCTPDKRMVATQPEPSNHTHPTIDPALNREKVASPHAPCIALSAGKSAPAPSRSVHPSPMPAVHNPAPLSQPQTGGQPVNRNRHLLPTQSQPPRIAGPPILPSANPEQVASPYRADRPSSADGASRTNPFAVDASTTPTPPIQAVPRLQTAGGDTTVGTSSEPVARRRQADPTPTGGLFTPPDRVQSFTKPSGQTRPLIAKRPGTTPRHTSPSTKEGTRNPPGASHPTRANPQAPTSTTTQTHTMPTRLVSPPQSGMGTPVANSATSGTVTVVAQASTNTGHDTQPAAGNLPPAESRPLGNPTTNVTVIAPLIAQRPSAIHKPENRTLFPTQPKPHPLSHTPTVVTQPTATQPPNITPRQTTLRPSRSTPPTTADVRPTTIAPTPPGRVSPGEVASGSTLCTERTPPLKTVAARASETSQQTHNQPDPAGVWHDSAPSLPAPPAGGAATAPNKPAPSPSAQPAALLESWCAGITAALPANPTGGATLRCHINLPNMPELAVQVRLEGGMLRLQLDTDDAATHRLLAEHLPALRERLRDRLEQQVHLSLPKPGNPHSDDDRPRDRRRQRRRGGQEQGSAS